jgi:hypothetical protein
MGENNNFELQRMKTKTPTGELNLADKFGIGQINPVIDP